MRLRALSIALFLLGLIVAAHGQLGQITPPPILVVPGGGCGASASLIARMDGAQNTAAVQTLICGMVTDGSYSLLDGLYVFATNSTANANLNWAQNNYNLTQVGTVTFTANAGYTGNGTTGYFTTGFNPRTATTPQYQLNSATLGWCDATSNTVVNSAAIMGANDGTNRSYVQTLASGPQANVFINALSGTGAFSISNGQGSWMASRSGSAQTNLFHNGTSIGSIPLASSNTANDAFFLLALNSSGTASAFHPDLIAWMLFGAGTNSVVTSIRSRLNTYLSTVGGTSNC